MQNLNETESKLINSIRDCKNKNILSQFQSILDKVLTKEEKDKVNHLFATLKQR